MKTWVTAGRAPKLCESRGGRPGFPVPTSPYGLCGRKATMILKQGRLKAQELCESRGGRPGIPVPNSPYGLCGRKATLEDVLLCIDKWTDDCFVTR